MSKKSVESSEAIVLAPPRIGKKWSTGDLYKYGVLPDSLKLICVDVPKHRVTEYSQGRSSLTETQLEETS